MRFFLVLASFHFFVSCGFASLHSDNSAKLANAPTHVVFQKGNLILLRGQSIETQLNSLIFQNDGNVVLYNRHTNKALWATKTQGSNATRFVFQGDGNLVLYGLSGPLWNSATMGKGHTFSIQSDQNVVIYNSSAIAVWGTGTFSNPTAPVKPQPVSLAVYNFENSWTSHALKLQSQLDADAPLGRSTFLGTHNSYNSKAYANLGRYHDPNQIYSIYEQLKLGVRAIELDVHSFLNNPLALCHANSSHVGCSLWDRSFHEALNEIKWWLHETASAPEVLLIYIESHIEGSHYDKAVAEISEKIGSFVYRPRAGTCDGISMEITKRELIQMNKRVLLVTDGCKNANFNSWVFGGVGPHRLGIPTDDQSTFQRLPACSSQRFDHASFDNLLIRFFEDRTRISGIFSPRVRLDVQISTQLLLCGANLMGWDMLSPDDGRLDESVWSWERGEVLSRRGCVQIAPNGRLKIAECETSLPFACREVNGTSWMITKGSGTWHDGENLCSRESGERYKFAVPYSAADLRRLHVMHSEFNIERVWTNYFN